MGRGALGRHARDRHPAVQIRRRVGEAIVKVEIAEAGRDDIDADGIRPLQRAHVVHLLDACFGPYVFGLGEQVRRTGRDPAQPAGDAAREEGPHRGAVELRPGLVVRLIAHHRIAEHEIVLRRDRDARERRRRGVEAPVEDGDSHAARVVPGVGQRAQVELTVGHLGGAVRGVSARGAGIGSDRGPRRRIRTGRRAPAAGGLDAAEQRLARQLAQARRRHVGAERVQPTAADAHPRAGGGRAGRCSLERDAGLHEQPHGERRVALPDAR